MLGQSLLPVRCCRLHHRRKSIQSTRPSLLVLLPPKILVVHLTKQKKTKCYSKVDLDYFIKPVSSRALSSNTLKQIRSPLKYRQCLPHDYRCLVVERIAAVYNFSSDYGGCNSIRFGYETFLLETLAKLRRLRLKGFF